MAEGQRVFHVAFAVKRLDLRQPLAGVFARAPFRVLTHDMRRVAQQYFDQLRSGVGTIDLSFKALLHEERNFAAVVDMRVGQEDGIDIGGAEGEFFFLVLLLVHPLVRAAVD